MDEHKALGVMRAMVDGGQLTDPESARGKLLQTNKGNIIFLRKLVSGGSEHSFGIHVAKLAGMPSKVVNRASEILKTLEDSRSNSGSTEKIKRVTEENLQLSFFQLDDPVLENIREELTKIDINTLTPIEPR